MAGLRRQEAEGGTPEQKSDYIPACAEGRMSGDRDHRLAVPLCVCAHPTGALLFKTKMEKTTVWISLLPFAFTVGLWESQLNTLNLNFFLYKLGRQAAGPPHLPGLV